MCVTTDQVHNFFIQRVRRNESKERNPVWVERYKLTDPDRRARLESSRRWAQRYTGYSRPVQFDEEGNEVFLDEEDDGFDMHPALAARQRLQRARTGEAPPQQQSDLVEQEEFYNRDPAPAYSAPWRELPAENTSAGRWIEEAAPRKDRSLKSRTLKMLGARGTGGETFSSAYTGSGAGSGSAAARSSAPSASAAGMDDLDRELMGLSTQDVPQREPAPFSPPSVDADLLEVQATGPGVDAMDREIMGLPNVEPVRTTPPRRAAGRRPERARTYDDLDRDVLDVDHTF